MNNTRIGLVSQIAWGIVTICALMYAFMFKHNDPMVFVDAALIISLGWTLVRIIREAIIATMTILEEIKQSKTQQ